MTIISTIPSLLSGTFVVYLTFSEVLVAFDNRSDDMHDHKMLVDGQYTWRGTHLIALLLKTLYILGLFYFCFLPFIISTGACETIQAVIHHVQYQWHSGETTLVVRAVLCQPRLKKMGLKKIFCSTGI